MSMNDTIAAIRAREYSTPAQRIEAIDRACKSYMAWHIGDEAHKRVHARKVKWLHRLLPVFWIHVILHRIFKDYCECRYYGGSN